MYFCWIHINMHSTEVDKVVDGWQIFLPEFAMEVTSVESSQKLDIAYWFKSNNKKITIAKLKPSPTTFFDIFLSFILYALAIGHISH